MYRVIATGSTGNAVLYHNSILIDCGVPFALIEPFLKDIQIVLLTHKHSDHINPATLERMVFERPSLRIGYGVWMWEHVKGFRNIDEYEIGKLYDYGAYQICPVRLYHDVPNCGYRIFKDNYKIFHATDTAHLSGITAKNYDLYAIEHNYNEETIDSRIDAKQSQGQYSHEKGVINSHLSEQQARDFIYNNRKPDSEVLRLHEPTRTLN
jgi:L-ascorbate metabolism protein UlaG (beta-lactamase superfamily)